MEIMEHKKELRESINKFIRDMHDEHGFNIITTKDILISEVFDSASEIGTRFKAGVNNDVTSHARRTKM
jgi:hypothetical protein